MNSYALWVRIGYSCQFLLSHRSSAVFHPSLPQREQSLEPLMIGFLFAPAQSRLQLMNKSNEWHVIIDQGVRDEQRVGASGRKPEIICLENLRNEQEPLCFDFFLCMWLNDATCVHKLQGKWRLIFIHLSILYSCFFPTLGYRGLLERIPAVKGREVGHTLDRSPANRKANTQRQTGIHSHTYGQFRLISSSDKHDFGSWEETGKPGENPHVQGEHGSFTQKGCLIFTFFKLFFVLSFKGKLLLFYCC